MWGRSGGSLTGGGYCPFCRQLIFGDIIGFGASSAARSGRNDLVRTASGDARGASRCRE